MTRSYPDKPSKLVRGMKDTLSAFTVLRETFFGKQANSSGDPSRRAK